MKTANPPHLVHLLGLAGFVQLGHQLVVLGGVLRSLVVCGVGVAEPAKDLLPHLGLLCQPERVVGMDLNSTIWTPSPPQ